MLRYDDSRSDNVRSVHWLGQGAQVTTAVEPLSHERRGIREAPSSGLSSRGRSDGEPQGPVRQAFDDEPLLASERMPGEGAVGETLAIRLVDNGDDLDRLRTFQGPR